MDDAPITDSRLEFVESSMGKRIAEYVIAIFFMLMILGVFAFILSGPDGDHPTNWYDVTQHPWAKD